MRLTEDDEKKKTLDKSLENLGQATKLKSTFDLFEKKLMRRTEKTSRKT